MAPGCPLFGAHLAQRLPKLLQDPACQLASLSVAGALWNNVAEERRDKSFVASIGPTAVTSRWSNTGGDLIPALLIVTAQPRFLSFPPLLPSLRLTLTFNVRAHILMVFQLFF